MNTTQQHLINYMDEYLSDQGYDDFSSLESWELLKPLILDALSSPTVITKESNNDIHICLP